MRGADAELLRTYHNPEGLKVQLYVAYLASQQQGKEIVNNETARLHWHADEVETGFGPGRSISINRGFWGDENNKHRILFWYHINGWVLANRYLAKLATTVGALWNRRTNGSLVVIAADPPDSEGEIDPAVVEDFIHDLLPVLRSYLP